MKQCLLIMLLAMIVMSGLMLSCKKSQDKNVSTGYSSYFPDWSSTRLEDPKNAVLVNDESLYCYGNADKNPLHFTYNNASYDLHLKSTQPAAESPEGWYFEADVRTGNNKSFGCTIGKYNDGFKSYYKLEFSPGYSSVFNSKVYIKEL